MKVLTVFSIWTTLLFTIPVFFGCDRSNNILLGRVETKIGTHQIVVTDCYITSVPAPENLGESGDGTVTYSWKPCRDAEIIIRGESLIVNGASYGRIKPGDAVTVDHGKVLVNEREAIMMK